MRALAFKECFAVPIAGGGKSGTVRKRSSRTPDPGETLRLSVRGETFAIARVTRVEDYVAADLAALTRVLDFPSVGEMTAAIDALYPARPDRDLVVIHFEVLERVSSQ